jgi:hypothetical protein
MNDQTNAFSRAANALGKVENLIKSGDDILSSVATAQQTMTSATGNLESTMTELGLIKDALSSASVEAQVDRALDHLRDLENSIQAVHVQTMKSVAEQVDRALNHLRDLENSIRAVHGQTMESVEKNSLKLDQQLDDSRREIVKAINTAKQEAASRTKGLFFLLGAVGTGVLIIIYGLYSYGILFS